MKKTILLFALLMLLEECLSAQDSLMYRSKTYFADLQEVSGKWFHSYLTTINDSTLIISETRDFLGFSPRADSEQGRLFIYYDIGKLYLKRRGSAAKGALYGGLIGAFSFGALASFLVAALQPRNGSSLVASFAFAGIIPGAVVGAVIGEIARKSFKIDGKKEKFMAMRTRMISDLIR